MKFGSYDEAVRWLSQIGGRVRGPLPKTAGYDAVTVFIPGRGVERTAFIDKTLTGPAYEAATRRAIRDACNEFHAAGAERLARGT